MKNLQKIDKEKLQKEMKKAQEEIKKNKNQMKLEMEKAKKEIDNETSYLKVREEVVYKIENTELPEKDRLFFLI